MIINACGKNEVLAYKMETVILEKENTIIVSPGYAAAYYIDGVYEDTSYVDVNLGKQYRGKRCDIYVLSGKDKRFECRYGVGKSGNVLNSFGSYSISFVTSLAAVKNLIREFNLGTIAIDINVIRDRINAAIPEAFSRKEVVDKETAKEALKQVLEKQLQGCGLQLNEVHIEGINFGD